VEDECEIYSNQPAFTEAMQANRSLPFNLIIGNLHRYAHPLLFINPLQKFTGQRSFTQHFSTAPLFNSN
jgi:hypothetical protein